MAQKPRNFSAMREDRVIAMARANFNRDFHDKASAIKALSRLAVKEQHALAKPRDPTSTGDKRPAPKRSTFNNELRGGLAPPSSSKLAEAPAAVVKRYARMTTGLDAKSKAQALTLMAKLGPTDVARAAGGAIGRGGFRKSSGPTMAELTEQYRQKHGVAPSSAAKRSKAAMLDAIATSPRAVPSLKPTAQAAAPRAAMIAKPKGGSRLALAAGVAAGIVTMLAGRANSGQETSQMAEKKSSMPTGGELVRGVASGMINYAVLGAISKFTPLKIGGPTRIIASAVGAAVGTSATSAKAEGANPAPSPVDQAVTNAILNRRIEGRLPAGNEKVMSERIPHMMTPPGYTETLRASAPAKPVDGSSDGTKVAAISSGALSLGGMLLSAAGKGRAAIVTTGAAAALGVGSYFSAAAKSKAAGEPASSSSRAPAAAPAPSSSGTYERTYKSGPKAGMTETVTIKR